MTTRMQQKREGVGGNRAWEGRVNTHKDLRRAVPSSVGTRRPTLRQGLRARPFPASHPKVDDFMKARFKQRGAKG